MNVAPIIARAPFVTKINQSSGYPMRAMQWFITLLLVLLGSSMVLADGLTEETEWAIFVSQRTGATELYLINLETKQVSQLTNTGRGHLTPATALSARRVAYAAREASSYQLFVAEISSAWRTRRPLLTAINRLTIDPIDAIYPTLSGDGSLLAFATGRGIELMATTGQGRRVLVPASPNLVEFAPALSPDGQQVAFISNRSGEREIWLASTVNGAVRQLTSGAKVLGGLSWSADSQQIVFTTENTPSKLTGIAIVSVANGNVRVLTEGGDSEAAISPGGTRIIFTSTRDGDPELYLLEMQTGAVKRLTNNPGADGTAVFISAATSPLRRTPPSRRVTFVERKLRIVR
jgi:TolB protein